MATDIRETLIRSIVTRLRDSGTQCGAITTRAFVQISADFIFNPLSMHLPAWGVAPGRSVVSAEGDLDVTTAGSALERVAIDIIAYQRIASDKPDQAHLYGADLGGGATRQGILDMVGAIQTDFQGHLFPELPTLKQQVALAYVSSKSEPDVVVARDRPFAISGTVRMEYLIAS